MKRREPIFTGALLDPILDFLISWTMHFSDNLNQRCNLTWCTFEHRMVQESKASLVSLAYHRH